MGGGTGFNLNPRRSKNSGYAGDDFDTPLPPRTRRRIEYKKCLLQDGSFVIGNLQFEKQKSKPYNSKIKTSPLITRINTDNAKSSLASFASFAVNFKYLCRAISW